MALEFYKMMQSEGAGSAKISKIELVDLTPEDAKKAAEIRSGDDGEKAEYTPRPTEKWRTKTGGNWRNVTTSQVTTCRP